MILIFGCRALFGVGKPGIRTTNQIMSVFSRLGGICHLTCFYICGLVIFCSFSGCLVSSNLLRIDRGNKSWSWFNRAIYPTIRTFAKSSIYCYDILLTLWSSKFCVRLSFLCSSHHQRISRAWVASNVEGTYKRSVTLGMAIGFGNINGAVTANIASRFSQSSRNVAHRSPFSVSSKRCTSVSSRAWDRFGIYSNWLYMHRPVWILFAKRERLSWPRWTRRNYRR